MKTIGQFAKDHNVTVKTLHYYEKLNLVTPKEVDTYTGYRYYGDKEARDLKLVLFLKELGLSLSEIRTVMDDGYTQESLLEVLEYKKNQIRKDKELASLRLQKITSFMSLLDEYKAKTLDYKELMGMSEEKLFSGKYGRGEFIEEAEKLFNVSKLNKTPLSVIQMDLDKFHNINKTHGYDVGDIVLDRTSNEIITVLQESNYNSMLERKGGDEFSVIVNAEGFEVSKLVSTILNRIVNVDYSDVTENLRVTITAGIASLTQKTDSISEMVQNATIELYKAKRNNK